jgi:mannose-6-phosphate isomerase-like protein (cupin superfamily)
MRVYAILFASGLLAVSPAGHAQSAGVAAKPLAERIVHTDTKAYRELKAVHDGAGSMDFAPLLGTDALSTNLIFVHRGVIKPKSGIGQHYHNQCEEMFVILDGEAEFTVNGRTSRLEGPAAVPNRMGSAHGIYNPTDRPVQWLNINVGMTKTYDAFNLGDPRLGATLDPIPQFISFRLDKRLLKSVSAMDGGRGTVQYRRALEPTVFSTPWTYVDHLLIEPGSSVGPAADPDVSQTYYVVAGAGSFTIDAQTAAIVEGDAIAVDLGEVRSIAAKGEALELLIIGVARDLATKASWSQAQAAARSAARGAGR